MPRHRALAQTSQKAKARAERIARRGILASALLLGATPAMSHAAIAPLHTAPDVRHVAAYDRADGTLLVIAEVAHRTRSSATARRDRGRLSLLLARNGAVVSYSATTALPGTRSRGAYVQYRALLSPKTAAPLKLRAGKPNQQLQLKLTATHLDGRRAVAQTSFTQRVPVLRVQRASTARAAAVAGADGALTATTTSGFPPSQTMYGFGWNSTPQVDLTWTDEPPYQAVVSAVYLFKPNYFTCVVQTAVDSNDRDVSGFVNAAGAFQLNSGFKDSTCEYYGTSNNAYFTGSLNTLPNANGVFPDGATMSFNMYQEPPTLDYATTKLPALR